MNNLYIGNEDYIFHESHISTVYSQSNIYRDSAGALYLIDSIRSDFSDLEITQEEISDLSNRNNGILLKPVQHYRENNEIHVISSKPWIDCGKIFNIFNRSVPVDFILAIVKSLASAADQISFVPLYTETDVYFNENYECKLYSKVIDTAVLNKIGTDSYIKGCGSRTDHLPPETSLNNIVDEKTNSFFIGQVAFYLTFGCTFKQKVTQTIQLKKSWVEADFDAFGELLSKFKTTKLEVGIKRLLFDLLAYSSKIRLDLADIDGHQAFIKTPDRQDVMEYVSEEIKKYELLRKYKEIDWKANNKSQNKRFRSKFIPVASDFLGKFGTDIECTSISNVETGAVYLEFKSEMSKEDVVLAIFAAILHYYEGVDASFASEENYNHIIVKVEKDNDIHLFFYSCDDKIKVKLKQGESPIETLELEDSLRSLLG